MVIAEHSIFYTAVTDIWQTSAASAVVWFCHLDSELICFLWCSGMLFLVIFPSQLYLLSLCGLFLYSTCY